MVRPVCAALKIKSGFPNDEEIKIELVNRGTCDVDHLILIGLHGSLTLDAINWCMDQSITISMVDYHGDLITDMVPPQTISPLVKQKQAPISETPKIKLAASLLGQKLGAQRLTLTAIGINEHRIKMFKEHERQLKTCKTVAEMRVIESHSANLYWGSFEGLPLQWKPKPVQPHWLEIGNRTSTKSLNARNSINPFHSCLNYLYTVLESRVKRYAVCCRLDCDYPVLHSNSRQNRSGLIYDLMEPIRPLVDRLLYQWIANQTLSPKDFLETREGICKIDPAFARRVMHLIKSLDLEINHTVKAFQGHFKSKMRDVSQAA